MEKQTNKITVKKPSKVDEIVKSEHTTKQDILTCLVDTLKNKKDSTTNILQSCENDLINLIIKYNKINNATIKKATTQSQDIYSNKPIYNANYTKETKKDLKNYLEMIFENNKKVINDKNELIIIIDTEDYKYINDTFFKCTGLNENYTTELKNKLTYKQIKEAIASAFCKKLTKQDKNTKIYNTTANLTAFWVALQGSVIKSIDNPNPKTTGGKK